MKKRQLTVEQCWCDVDYKSTNKYAIDAYLLDEFKTTQILEPYVAITGMDFADVLKEYEENFERRYKEILLFLANHPKISRFTVGKHILSKDTIEPYAYMALFYVMVFLRENVIKVKEKDADFCKLSLNFKDQLKATIMYDMIMHGTNSVIAKFNGIKDEDNIFSPNYKVTSIEYPHLEEDKAAILAVLIMFGSKKCIAVACEATDAYEEEIADLKKKIDRRDEKFKSLKKEYDSYKTKKSQERNNHDSKVKFVKDELLEKEKEVEELTMQVMTLEREVALLKDKNAIYELRHETQEEQENLKVAFEEAVEEVDLSSYKVIVVTTEDASNFGFSTLDLTNQTERMNRLMSYDIVAFDIRHNSHPCYNQVKKFCKTNKIEFAHMDCSPSSMEREIKKYILSRSVD